MGTVRDEVIQEIKQLLDGTLSALTKLLSTIRRWKRVPENVKRNALKVLANSHKRVRTLLASSKGKWASEVIKDREERL